MTKKPKSITLKSSIKNDQLFVKKIKELILSARSAVVRGVDLIQVRTNFEIGRLIFLQEQSGKNRADYGVRILQNLAEKLSIEFGSGFSLTNLKLMRQFYLQYRSRISQTQIDLLMKGQSVTDQLGNKATFSLSWTHYVFLLSIKNSSERNFSEIEATEQNWTVREVRRQLV